MTKERTKLPVQVAQPEALKKALERARDERARVIAVKTVDALIATNKKPFKVKHG